MLYKDIVAFYGRSLSGVRIEPQDDIVFCAGDMKDIGDFRQAALDDISGAKVFLLDGHAANYVDSLREDLGKDRDAYVKQVNQFIAETEMPSDLVWVEFDYKMLVADRLVRGHSLADGYGLEEFGLRGFLIDNRSDDRLKATLFRADGSGKIIDPSMHFTLEKSKGNADYSVMKNHYHPHMLQFFELAGGEESVVKEYLEQEQTDMGYDLAMSFILFALLTSSENGLLLEEKASLSAKEAKTAKKFGKTWMTDALRSHVTIRIGSEGKQHLEEHIARKSFEAKSASDRNAPVEHWVSEHERHYKSGKIVLIKGHRRGTKVDPSIPTRVVGPKK